MSELPERSGREYRIPATEKEDCGEARHRNHAGVFRDEEHGELEAGIFGVEAGDEFGFSFRQIEGHAVGFGNGGDKEAEKTHDLRKAMNAEDIPAQEAVLAAVLLIDNFRETETVGHQHHADYGHSER